MGRHLAGQGGDFLDRAAVGWIGRRLAGYEGSWYDRAAVGTGQGGSWQDKAAVGWKGKRLKCVVVTEEGSYLRRIDSCTLS